MMLKNVILAGLTMLLLPAVAVPPLPEANGQVALPVQDDPNGAPREINVYLRYPGGKRANITGKTGLMLVLHNWGGREFGGAPYPDTLVANFNVVAVGVDYLQSGDTPQDPKPYDFGYLQAMDALRALYYVYQGLTDLKIPFDAARIYGCGGSGGGNVITMANKFAPRTFACIVDLSGMASLTDDIAYNLPGGSGLDARFRRDPVSPAYLSKGMQEIRDTGNPDHLARMTKLGNKCKIVVIHGEDDTYCLVTDKKRTVDAMRAADLDVEPHFIAKADIDGKLILDSGHAIGNRTNLLLHFATPYLSLASPTLCRLAGLTDFVRKETITYPVSDGTFTISYADGCPRLAYTPAPSGK